MVWDETKQNDATDSTGELPAEEWNAHVDDQKSHSTRHESGGTDEISVAGLSGQLAEAQSPITEEVEDIVNTLLSAGADVTLSYDDTNGDLTISSTVVEEIVNDDTNGDYLTKIVGVTTLYWGNVDPSNHGETLNDHDAWIDTSTS